MPVKKYPAPDFPGDPEEVKYAQRVEEAYDEWKAAEGGLSLRAAAGAHGIPWETLRDRKNGATSKVLASQNMQRLSAQEELELKYYVEKLGAWGWPPMISELHKMAVELLKAKGDTKSLYKNWPQSFLRRHPDLYSRFVSPLDKSRALAGDEEQIRHYFALFKKTKEEYNIHDDDVYNMDEKGVMMGVLAKLHIVVSRSQKKPFITQPGSREWVSMIECICRDGRVLSPWIIFKGKQQLHAWFSEHFPDGHICVSPQGWTDNELCLEWLKLCFEPETAETQKGEYRMLLFDGHASHVTVDAIKYCEEKKIILFCLPKHSTHLLQPLDVGVFSPFATAYQRILLEKTKWGANYQIPKDLFLEIVQQARIESITPDNVRSS
jgi:hypothetical protein